MILSRFSLASFVLSCICGGFLSLGEVGSIGRVSGRAGRGCGERAGAFRSRSGRCDAEFEVGGRNCWRGG